MRTGFSASAIFDGDKWILNGVVVVNNGTIESILPQQEVGDVEIKSYNDSLLVPAFIDVQVYGAAKKIACSLS